MYSQLSVDNFDNEENLKFWKFPGKFSSDKELSLWIRFEDIYLQWKLEMEV